MNVPAVLETEAGIPLFCIFSTILLIGMFTKYAESPSTKTGSSIGWFPSLSGILLSSIFSFVTYNSSLDKVKIICPIHGEFFKDIKNHLITVLSIVKI